MSVYLDMFSFLDILYACLDICVTVCIVCLGIYTCGQSYFLNCPSVWVVCLGVIGLQSVSRLQGLAIK